MTDGFTKVPHKLWETPMELKERYMLLFLLDCENKFGCRDNWFSLADSDFISAGFGSDKSKWKKYRDSLIQRGWIEYKRGGSGQKSRYRFKRQEEAVTPIIPQEVEQPTEEYDDGPYGSLMRDDYDFWEEFIK